MSGKGKFAKGGVVGIVIGAVAGLLLAPKSGKETRDDIRKTVTHTKADAEKQLKKLHEELSHKQKDAKNAADSLKGKAKTELADVLEKSLVVQGRIKELISSLRDGELDQEEVDLTILDAKKITTQIDKKTKKK